MKDQLKLRILKIHPNGYHLSVTAKVNGKAANMVVDTGASQTVFDRERIKKFLKEEGVEDLDKLSTGLGTNTMQSQRVHVNKLSLGKIDFENFEVILLDLSHVIHSYEQIGLKPVDGVLGGDVLMKCGAVIDYTSKSLSLFSAKKKTKSKKSSKKITKRKK